MNKPSDPRQLVVNTLILGGGLSGLSTAYHLEKNKQTDYLLIEKQSFFGGLAASHIQQGFTFDYSGHLLHLRHPYALRLVRRLLKGNLLRRKRRAFVDIKGTRIPFPFQANLWALPPLMRQACLQGVVHAAKEKKPTPRNFEQWCLQSFGSGIYRAFLQPYNKKLWQTPSPKLTWDWCGSFVPTPNLRQITQGAKSLLRKDWGYNSYFYYPKQGGCGALAQAMANHIPNTWLEATVTHIDLAKRQAVINRKTVRYEKLVSTLPLPDLIALCSPVAKTIQQAAARLRHTTVHVLQIAVKRNLSDFDWIYFPDPEVPFYRVGKQSAFSAHNAPKGCSSLYIETADKITDFKAAEKAIFKMLLQKGIINKSDPILFSFWCTIQPAYAIYDFQRASSVRKLLDWLEKKQVYCAGRYGRWEYSFMERSLLQGKELADQLSKE